MAPTISDLLAYASQQARIEAVDYFHPRYARPDEIRVWRNDRYLRDRDRRRVYCAFAGRVRSAEPLRPGSYGRLEITADRIDYTACQYAAREIWPAIFQYLIQTNEA